MKMIAYSVLTILISCFTINCNNSTLKGDTISSAEIIKMINNGNDIYLVDKKVTGKLDFTTISKQFIKSKNIVTIEVMPSLTFINCEFDSAVIAFFVSEKDYGYEVNFGKNLSFIGCKFNKEVNFRQSKFKDDVNFSTSQFTNEVTFEGAYFSGSVNYFNEIVFDSTAKFTNAVFQNNAIFLSSVFKANTNFKKTFFGKDLNLSASNFYGYTDFGSMVVKGDFSLNYSAFNEEVIFNNCKFYGDADFVKIIFAGQTEIKNVLFYGNTKFNESTFKNIVLMEKSVFVLDVPDFNDIITEEGTNFVIDSCYSVTKNLFDFPDF